MSTGRSSRQRATRFVAAGGDQVLTIEASDLGPMVEALTTKADEDPAFARRLEESARRVLTLKSERGILRCAP